MNCINDVLKRLKYLKGYAKLFCVKMVGAQPLVCVNNNDNEQKYPFRSSHLTTSEEALHFLMNECRYYV